MSQSEDLEVKIAPLTEATRSVNQVREKPDGGSSHHQRHPGEQTGREQKEATPEEVAAAIESFGQDAQAQANGLNAATLGAGPGLRVVLKDGTGAVVRQFTGEEFLRLREAAAKGIKSCGKILDRKL